MQVIKYHFIYLPLHLLIRVVNILKKQFTKHMRRTKEGGESVADLLHLPKDDASLPLDGVIRELGILQDVGEHIDGDGHVLALHVGKEGGLLAGGVGVEAGAHVLDLLLKGAGGAAASALEDHVLEEMCGAIRTGRLEAAAGVDPDSDGGSMGGGRGCNLGDDADAVGEGGEADAREAEESGMVEQGS